MLDAFDSSTPGLTADVNPALSDSTAPGDCAGDKAPEPRGPRKARTRAATRKSGSRGSATKSTSPPAPRRKPRSGVGAKPGHRDAVAEGGVDADANRPGSVKPGCVDLLQTWADEPADADGSIALVRLNQDETAVIPFTSEGFPVKIHFCGDPEINGYVHCNGDSCLLCRTGRSQDERTLLPVYLPTSRSVAVLAISPSSRPGALRPQVMPILRSGKRVALLIRRLDRVAFKVGTVELQDGMDDGAEIIAGFLARWQAGQVDLAAVYPRLDNQDLAGLAGVAALMQLKRIEL
jgi:hypothetical protein